MKIGIVAMGLESSQDFRSAGVARYAYSLLDALTDEKFNEHTFHFFVLPSFEVPPTWLAANHVRVHRTWKRYNKWTLLVSGFSAAQLGLDFLFSTANTVPLLSPISSGVFIHDLFPLDHPEWFPEATAAVNARTIPRAIKSSKMIVANSEATKADIIRHFDVDESKIGVTPLAAGNTILRLDPSAIDRARLADLGIPFDRYLLTLSTIEPRKNLGRLLEAFSRLAAIPGFQNVGLVVAGSKGWKYEGALEMIDKLGLQEKVKLVGYVAEQDLPLLFGACELYLCPSVSEGFGMPLVEAMTAGAPVLSSKGGALAEVGGDAVRYFDPLSVNSMATCLIDALENSSTRKEWVELGLKQASLFTWTKTAEKTVTLIERSATR